MRQARKDQPGSAAAGRRLGIWKWELEFVSEGVVDIVWEVTPAAIDAQPRTIRLEPGEHAVFAYGSLLSIASLERTLGRSYRGPFVVCSIDGWRRRWNVSMPNETFAYRDASGWVTPQRIFYLNVESPPGRRHRHPLRRAEDLARFDPRESIYGPGRHHIDAQRHRGRRRVSLVYAARRSTCCLTRLHRAPPPYTVLI